MKKYEVIVTPEAEAGIVAAFRYIHDRSPQSASKWLRALYSKIFTLESFPRRCSIAREQEYFEEELRQLIFKSHRIIFQIEEKASVVRVLYIVHARQRAVGEREEDCYGQAEQDSE